MRKANTIKIGKTLKMIRKSQGYTQEKVAEMTEVSVRYISVIEQDRSMPSFEVLIRMCNLYKVSLDQIFNEYLKVKKNRSLEYSLAGYDKLSRDHKRTIEHLITYFNS